MMNFACFIPGTTDADFMRQQVGERGILEKIDTVNETIKQCLGEYHSVSGISDFYKMIHEIECNLNRNMNDPRAKKLVNTFDESPETPKPEAPTNDLSDLPDPVDDTEMTEPTSDPVGDPTNQIENTEVIEPAENTEVTEPTSDPVGNSIGNPTDQIESDNTADPDDNTEAIDPVGNPADTTDPTDGTETNDPIGVSSNESETKRPTKRGKKKSESTE